MSTELSTSLRCPRTDPRVGDIVQVIPPNGRHPAPLRILAVDDSWIHWERRGEHFSTERRLWSRTNRIGGGQRKMELVAEVSA